LLQGRCRRDLSTTPGLSTTRVTEITISYADLPLSGQIYRYPFGFLFCVRRLIALFRFYRKRQYPSIYLCSNTRHRVARITLEKRRTLIRFSMQDRKRESLAVSLRSFPSSLYNDMEIFSWLVESETQTLSHFQQIIDLNRGIVIEKCSAFEIPDNMNATARYAIPSGRIN